MANPEHVKIFKQGSNAVKAFREKNPMVQLDLSESDLVKDSLYAANLSEVNLRGANLSGVKLIAANLKEANLKEANLRGANLNMANLNGADLSEADLIEASLYATNLCGVNLREANLNEANLKEANLYKVNLREANLIRANLSEVKLSEANLSGANLIRAELNGANLNGANLSGTNLRGANLNGAKLSEANLSRVTLIEANLRGANLNLANLSGAQLSEADLIETSLREAEFNGTFLRSTVLADADLSDAKGLSQVRHFGPSTIGINTLYKSKGKIPEKFLRGCGLQEWEIENAKLYNPDLKSNEFIEIQYRVHELCTDPAVQFFSCFISYTRDDKPFANKLHDSLQERGIRCWLDEHQILPGDDIHAQVDRGVRLWDKVLLCGSQAALENSWWVDKEITTAFDKEAELQKERGEPVRCLIPLDLDGYMLHDWDGHHKTEITKRLAADFTGWESDEAKFKAQLERVVRALKAGNAGRERPPGQIL